MIVMLHSHTLKYAYATYCSKMHRKPNQERLWLLANPPKQSHPVTQNQTKTPLLIHPPFPLQAQNQSPQATQTLTAMAQNVGK
jgi:hypothetical protein